jgi:hypothetical protein
MPSEIIYSVFVSSTYEDLREERAEAQKALLELDSFPVGMEIFGAASEETWAFVKKQVADCDYFIIIIADRHGSTATDGKSYTEKEYDYAIEIGKPVLAFLHGDRGSIPGGKTERDPEKRAKLEAFIEKVRSRSPVSFFTSPHHLARQVAVSFTKQCSDHPAVGFIRADRVLPTTPFTAQDVYLDIRDHTDEIIKRKLRVVVRNDGDTELILKPARWQTNTGDIGILPRKEGLLLWETEGSKGWENGDWQGECPGAVRMLPGAVLRAYIGLQPSTEKVEVRRRHEIRRLGTLIIPFEADGRDEERRIRL